MSLVYHYVVDVQHFQIAAEERSCEPFRRNVKELAASVGGIVKCKVHLMARHARMNGYGLDATRLQVLHLILHKGDERCDHQSSAIAHKRRQLEADALATARRQDCKGVTALQGGVYYLLLHGSESIIAPYLLQYLQSVVHNVQNY